MSQPDLKTAKKASSSPKKTVRQIAADKVTDQIRSLTQKAILRGYQSAGFEQEDRHWGDQKITLWRKSLALKKTATSPRSSRGSLPRRIVLVPGFGDSPLSWTAVLTLIHPALRADYDELILMELPGFSGAMESETPFDSFDQLFDATAETLAHLQPRAILAHSLGGWLAAHYACLEPALARSKKRKPALETLFLIAPSGSVPKAKELRPWARIFKAATIEGFKPMRQHIFHNEPIWFRLIMSEFTRFTTKKEIKLFLHSFKPKAHLLHGRIENIEAKTWLIWGDSDTLVPTSWASSWLHQLQEVTDKKLVLIKETGHSPQLERPAVLSAIIAQILKGQAPHRWGSRWYEVKTSIGATA